ncbi:MAG TPA: ATP-binding cassette domain-containing protein, partial [Ktedonobacterales bacterium]|nr:ATP-binding cassette domain-containing protein [Ktedonobacterales bacterium]
MSILVEHLSYIYNPRTPGARTALRDVSLRIKDGTCAAIVGVTGSGKSTLVQHFNGLLKPAAGHVVVDGVDVGARETRGVVLRDLRRRVGLLFQFPEAQLFAPTVYDDIAFGMRQIGLDDATIDRQVRAALAAVALEADDALLFRSPFALSGGQRRRVALAGVLAQRPRVLVLDEPSAGLDAEARDELYAQLARLRAGSVRSGQTEDGQRAGMTIVLVSHDMSEVATLADTMFVLADGELRLAGTPEEVFQHTEDIAAAGLLPPPLAQVVALAHARGLALQPARLTLD